MALATGTEAADWGIRTTGSGRPVVRSRVPDDHWHDISLAHSAGHVVAAVTDAGTVGVDLELVRPRDCRGMAEYLGWSLPDPESDDGISRFHHLWTIWEAVFKAASGQPDQSPEALFAGLHVRLTAGRPGQWSAGNLFGESWFLDPGCWLSLACIGVQDADIRLVVEDVDD